MIHNVHQSLCLEEIPESGEVEARKCRLDSDSQQWVWEERSRLVNVATSRCLSAHHTQPVRTQPCPGPWEGERARALDWDCDRDRLISRNNSLMLSLSRRRLALTDEGKNIRWRSLDKGDICQETLRSRRASEEFEVVAKPTISAEEKEYLRWFYRTEDPTYWKFALLGLAFICLLIGFMLLGMGAMANKNRKKIAKYKAAAAVLQKRDCEELQVISLEDARAAPATPPAKPPASSPPPLPPNGELSESRPGDIVLTYKDGNTSSLYPDAAAEVRLTGEEVEEGERETTATEPQSEERLEGETL